MTINEELAKAGIHRKFDTNEIRTASQTIYEWPLTSRELSDIILEKSFPSNTEKYVSHYTSLNAFQNIVEGGELRLYAVRKRMSENELSEFFERLGFVKGEQINPTTNRPVYDEFADDLFYTSLSEEKDSDHLWTWFAENRTGVRLDFFIQAHVPDFRQVSYSETSHPIISSLVKRLRKEYGKELLLRGASKICAFLLPPSYEDETEQRLLVARNSDEYALSLSVCKDNDGNTYVALPIDGSPNAYYKIELTGLKAGPDCDLGKFDAIVNRCRLKALVV